MNTEQRTQLVDVVMLAKRKIQAIENIGQIGRAGGKRPWHDTLDIVREEGRLEGLGHAIEILTNDEEQWFLIEREASNLIGEEQVPA